MSNVLIATIYRHEPVVASLTRVSADRLFILVDHEPDSEQRAALDTIYRSFEGVLEIREIKTDVYDILAVARQVVQIIDMLSDNDDIYIDISAGRKTKALGLLFAAYARSERIEKILYIREKPKGVVYLPKLSFHITKAQLRILERLSKQGFDSMTGLADEVDLSRAMLYKHIKELKDLDMIKETDDGWELTDFGQLVVL